MEHLLAYLNGTAITGLAQSALPNAPVRRHRPRPRMRLRFRRR